MNIEKLRQKLLWKLFVLRVALKKLLNKVTSIGEML